MSLFASEKRVKIYLKDGKVSKKETPDWIEVREELPLSLKEEHLKVAPKKVEMEKNGNMIINMESINMIPYNFLAKVITGWSEAVPVSVENLKKLRADLLDEIMNELSKMYGLNNGLAL